MSERGRKSRSLATRFMSKFVSGLRARRLLRTQPRWQRRVEHVVWVTQSIVDALSDSSAVHYSMRWQVARKYSGGTRARSGHAVAAVVGQALWLFALGCVSTPTRRVFWRSIEAQRRRRKEQTTLHPHLEPFWLKAHGTFPFFVLLYPCIFLCLWQWLDGRADGNPFGFHMAAISK